MFGLSVVTISLLLHQQLSTIGLLLPSTAMAAPGSVSAAKLQPAAATVDNGPRQRNENGFFSDDVDPLITMESQADEWRPEDSVRLQHLNDEEPIAVGLGQRRYNKLHPALHNSLLSDSKQQQQSAAAAAWLNGLIKRRAHIFVGKRNGIGSLSAGSHHLLGIRPEADDDSDIVDGKRSRMFVGKRPSSFYPDDDVDDTIDVDDWQSSRQPGRELAAAEKRSRMFVGKKYAPVFVG